MALITGIDGLELQTTPSYANQEVTSLESSNEDVVEVISTASNGVATYRLVPKREGTATITATLGDDITTSTTITVTKGSTVTPSSDEGPNEGTGESSTDTGEAQVEIPVTGIQFHSDTDVNYLITELPLPKSPNKLVNMASYVSVYPSSANQGWILSSSNSSVLEVQTDGTGVYAKNLGTATLIVTSRANPNCSDEITVTVYAQAAESVQFVQTEKTLMKGSRWTCTSNIRFTPDEARYSEYTITSSNRSVVSVSGDELLAVDYGQATITVTSGSKSDTMTINVPDNSTPSDPDAPVALQSFEIQASNNYLTSGDDFSVTVLNLEPSEADTSLGHFTLTISDGSISVVEQNGTSFRMLVDNNITSERTVSIYGTWIPEGSGLWPVSSDPIYITVSPRSSGGGSSDTSGITSVSVSFSGLPESGIATVGDILTAIRTVVPSGAPISYTRWTSGNTSVATVDNNGKITCLAPGIASITVEVDGPTYATKTLWVGDSGEASTGPWDELRELTGTNIADPIVPFTTWDDYPTHYAKYGKGGYRSVTCKEEMYAIASSRREEGMLIWVMSDTQLYQYRSGMFVPISFGGNGAITPGGNNDNPGGGNDNPGGGNNNPGGGDLPIDPGIGQTVDLSDILRRLSYLEGLHRQQDQANKKADLVRTAASVKLTNVSPTRTEYLVGEDAGELSFTWGLSGLSSSEAEPLWAKITPISGPIVTYMPNQTSYSYSPIPNTLGTKTCKIQVHYFDKRFAVLDEYADKGGWERDTAEKSISLTFGYYMYYGSTTLDIPNASGDVWSSITTLSNPSKTGIKTSLDTISFRYTISSGRAFVAFPKAFISGSTPEAVKNKIDIVDSKGDSYSGQFSLMSITVPGVNGSSVDYWLYYLTVPSSVDHFLFKFSKI